MDTTRAERNRELAAKAQTGDMAAKEQLFAENQGLVGRVVAQCSRLNIRVTDDFASEGNLGMLEALAKYDPAKGEWSTYATQWIRAKVLRYAAESQGMPSDAFWALMKLEGHTSRKGISACSMQPAEVRQIVGLPARTDGHASTCDVVHYVAGLRERRLDKKEYLFGELDKDNDPAENAAANEYGRYLFSLIWALDDNRQKVLRWHYGFGCDPVTITQIGDRLNITKRRVSQLHSEGIGRLRAVAKSY